MRDSLDESFIVASGEHFKKKSVISRPIHDGSFVYVSE